MGVDMVRGYGCGCNVIRVHDCCCGSGCLFAALFFVCVGCQFVFFVFFAHDIVYGRVVFVCVYVCHGL